MANSNRPVPHPFILPHELFSKLHDEKPDLWADAICGEEGSCEEFWEECLDDPDIRNRPALTSGANKRKLIPLGMRGDAAAHNKTDSLLTLAWNSLLSTGPTLKKRFVYTVCS